MDVSSKLATFKEIMTGMDNMKNEYLMLKKEEENISQREIEWQKNNNPEKYKAQIAEMIENECAHHTAFLKEEQLKLENSLKAEEDGYFEEKKIIEEKISECQKELDNTKGLFTGSKKKKINQEITELTEQLKLSEERLSALRIQYKTFVDSMDENIRSHREETESTIKLAYPFPKSPKEELAGKLVVFQILNDLREISEKDDFSTKTRKANCNYSGKIILMLKYAGRSLPTDVIAEFAGPFGFGDFSLNKYTALLVGLRNANIVEGIVNNGVREWKLGSNILNYDLSQIK